MSDQSIRFPLALSPVVRSREGGLPDGGHLPYHPVIVIVDAEGRRVADIGPDADDVRAGRAVTDPHQLVARAARVVVWLEDLHSRVAALAESLADPDSLLLIRPYMCVNDVASRVDAGVQFCSTTEGEFDRITQSIRIRGDSNDLEKNLDELRERTRRRYESATAILIALREAVHSWRDADAVTASDQSALRIADGVPEH